jgi:hypothetical protein
MPLAAIKPWVFPPVWAFPPPETVREILPVWVLPQPPEKGRERVSAKPPPWVRETVREKVPVPVLVPVLVSAWAAWVR